MSVLDINERRAYLQSPYFKKHEYGDFSPFYITITVCTIVVAIIFILNIVLGCCSKHTRYWNDRHTGNRWLVSLWTATPHLQPSLDYTELDPKFIPTKVVAELPRDLTQYSDLGPSTHEHEPYQYEQEPRSSRQVEYVELQHQKSRESDI